MANQDLELALRIQADVQQALREMKRMNKGMGDVAQGEKKAAKEAKNLDRQLDKTEGTMGRVITAANRMAAALGLIVAGKEVVNATLEMERLRSAMRFAVGDSQRAGKELEWVAEQADRLGIDLRAAADSYVQIAAASKGTALAGEPTRDIFLAIAEASRVMGLSADDTRGALNAISQMISKGTVQAEELRGQLGERLPGAFQIAARAMGVSTQELGKMLENGEVLAEDLLPKLANEIRSSVGESLEDATQGSAATFARFKNELFELAAAFGEAGITDAVAGTVDLLTEFLGTLQEIPPEIQRVARFAARISSGPLSDIDELTADLEELQAMREASAIGRTRLFGEGGVIKTYTPEEIDARIQEIKDTLKLLYSQEGLELPKPEEPAGGGGDGGAGGKKGGSTDEDEIQKRIKALEEEAATLGMTAKQIELYRLRLMGANEEQLKRARVAIEAVESEQEFEAAVRASEEAVKAENAEYQKWMEGMQQAADSVRSMIDPYRDLVKELEQVERLYQLGLLTFDEWAEASLQIQARMDEIGEQAKEQADAMSEFAVQAARNIQTILADELFNGFENGLEGMVHSFSEAIKRMAAEAVAAQLAAKLFGDFGSTGEIGGYAGQALNFVAGLFHGGGVVGAGGGMRRSVHPAIFAGAQRFHDGGMPGLAPDEVPAILQRGEEVLAKDDPRNAANPAGGSGVRILNVLDPAMVEDYMSSSEGERTILNVLQRNAGAVKEVLV